MNHQTEDLLEKAKEIVQDEGVFSSDQITVLMNMIDWIGNAIDKECGCVKSGCVSIPMR